MKKLILSLILLCSCADAPDSGDADNSDDVETDGGIGRIDQASYCPTCFPPDTIWVRANPAAGFSVMDTTYTRTSGLSYASSQPLRIKKNGTHGACTGYNASGAWCDGVWYWCPSQVGFLEEHFYVYNPTNPPSGANWNWNAPGTYPKYTYFDLVGSVAWGTGQLTTTAVGAAGQISLVCNYGAPGFTLAPDTNGGT